MKHLITILITITLVNHALASYGPTSESNAVTRKPRCRRRRPVHNPCCLTPCNRKCGGSPYPYDDSFPVTQPITPPIAQPISTIPSCTPPTTPIIGQQQQQPYPLPKPIPPPIPDITKPTQPSLGTPVGTGNERWDYKLDYGEDQFKKLANDEFQITLDKPNQYTGGDAAGARMKSTYALTSGKLCANLKPGNPVSGTVMAMYLSSEEPEPGRRAESKWDELDFEFVGKNASASVWTNVFHDGDPKNGEPDMGRPNPLPFLPSAAFHEYCLVFDIGQGYAKWLVDGKIIRQETLNGWVKPLYAYISYWGNDAQEKWMGKMDLSQLPVHGIIKTPTFTSLVPVPIY